MRCTDESDAVELLSEAIGLEGSDRLAPLHRSVKSVRLPDATQKWGLYQRSSGRLRGVVLWSSSVRPGMMAEFVETQRRIVARLSDRTAAVVLRPTRTGEAGGRSFALFPYYPPVERGRWRGRWSRWRLRGQMLGWLRAVTAESSERTENGQVCRAFVEPLERLAAEPAMGVAVREEAERAIHRAGRGDWHPRTVASHNDLGVGNLLSAPARRTGGFGFFVIDWGLAQPAGQPLYDLVRLAGSLPLGRGRLRAEVDRHCAILGCERQDAMGYLLAGLGWVRGNLGYFPHERFVRMSHQCVARLREAV